MGLTRKKVRLGELLIKHKVITEEQLATAIAKQKTDGGKLGEILIELNHLDDQTLLNFLAKQLDIDFVDLKYYPLKPDLIRDLPESIARRFRAILLDKTDNNVLVGMVDPQDIYAYDELARLLKQPFKVALIYEPELLRVIDMVYRRTADITKFAEELTEELIEAQYDLAQLGKELGASDAPVVKLLQSIFEDAMQVNASDIHIEPDEKVLRIRQRIDGVLQEQIMPKTVIAPALTVRLKLMAGLNIAERRLPQDGRFSIKVRNKNIDVRLSTMPVQYGESLVMRLLDHSAALLQLEETGLSTAMLKPVRKFMHFPYGMMLITGPTGSGKTTTLYGMLNELNVPGTKIITVEDPVEYRLPRISQVQVNSTINLDFSRVLRSALRQDPDIIMVGEVRDKETASIALRAAMTGHLVLATMHTNDSISAVLRLLDMQSEGYLVAASLRIVMAQRLIRKICESCIKPYQPTVQEASWFAAVAGKSVADFVFKKGGGCAQCNQTGYKGRTGVFEMLEIDEEMVKALGRNDGGEFTQIVRNKHLPGLWQSALDLVYQNISTLSEVMRISTILEGIPDIG